MKRHTKDEFIKLSNEKHKNTYNYDKVEYKNNSTKVCIICPIHGDFWMTPANHLYGQGCPKCGIEKRATVRRKTIDDFIKEATEKYGNRYDYSSVVYKGCDKKVCIICKEHGEFYQTPYHHLNGKVGCPKCSGNVKLCNSEFIKKAKCKHGEKYDYSKVMYENANDKVCIVCPTHGEFWQFPSSHLAGSGCPKCVGKQKNTDDFVSESKLIYGNVYDYTKTIYNGAYTNIIVTCPIHGDFTTIPHTHLRGSGCPKCSTSSLERKCLEYFENNSIQYEYQKTFDWLYNESIFKNRKYLLRLDFYFEKYKTAIECQGIQHFEKNQFFDKRIKLKERQNMDIKKYELCKENGIRIVYFTNDYLLKHISDIYIYRNNLFSDISIIMKLCLTPGNLF